jgi:predicted ABC-type ATPase
VAPLLVITGPPGAGKSTVARIVADRLELSVLVDGDSFFAFLAQGAIAPWLAQADAQNAIVTQAAAAAAGRYAAGGYATVYDGVVGPWFLSTFAAATGLSRLDYLILLPPVDRCVNRVRSRQGHGFTDPEATRLMHDAFVHADVDQRHLLADPPDDPQEVADLALADLARGKLAYAIPGPSSAPST